MKLHSAGIAWHDAYYIAGKEPDNGVMVQQSSKCNTSAIAMNHALAGVIQSTITMLPIPLQIVGHWLYAPCDMSAEYKNDTWAMVAARGGVHQDQREMYFLAHAAIHAYKDMAVGKPESVTLNKPLRIRRWMIEQHGIAIDSANWSRKYKDQWDRFIAVLDELDKRALGPVAAAINEANREVDLEGDSFSWGNKLVNFCRTSK